MRATQQEGTYPRPRLLREAWQSLDGSWDFEFDDQNEGLRHRWYLPETRAFSRTIQVPFVPESKASGVARPDFHAVVWYRRQFRAKRKADRRTILHFGAVDYVSDVWVDGQHAVHHVGGQTSFSVDVTDLLTDDDSHHVVLRAEDDPMQSEFPRGKQDWEDRPHSIWYERSTGVWRSVWAEEVSSCCVIDSIWNFKDETGALEFEVELSSKAASGSTVEIEISLDERSLTAASLTIDGDRAAGTIEIPVLRNAQGRQEYLWSPGNPVLLDIALRLIHPDKRVLDEVATYCGLRTVAVDRGQFLLNDQPYFVRSVLEQGFWPESHLTAPSVEAYREEVEIIKSLGFNAARVHQKVEDPRFHYWADRLGLLLWGETAAPYQFTARGATALMLEWCDIVRQFKGHPSIVTWVPVNESWGVPNVARSAAQQEFVRAISSMTRAIDPTRPVVSNDGWEHVSSDILTVHDYTPEGSVLRARYLSVASFSATLEGIGPSGRRLLVNGASTTVDIPVMVTEFGGISYADDETWGYAVVGTDEEFIEQTTAVFNALNQSSFLAGFCYTQLTDTMQEANGLLYADRTPKIALETLRSAVLGLSAPNPSIGEML